MLMHTRSCPMPVLHTALHTAFMLRCHLFRAVRSTASLPRTRFLRERCPPRPRRRSACVRTTRRTVRSQPATRTRVVFVMRMCTRTRTRTRTRTNAVLATHRSRHASRAAQRCAALTLCLFARVNARARRRAICENGHRHDEEHPQQLRSSQSPHRLRRWQSRANELAI